MIHYGLNFNVYPLSVLNAALKSFKEADEWHLRRMLHRERREGVTKKRLRYLTRKLDRKCRKIVMENNKTKWPKFISVVGEDSAKQALRKHGFLVGSLSEKLHRAKLAALHPLGHIYL